LGSIRELDEIILFEEVMLKQFQVLMMIPAFPFFAEL